MTSLFPAAGSQHNTGEQAKKSWTVKGCTPGSFPCGNLRRKKLLPGIGYINGFKEIQFIGFYGDITG